MPTENQSRANARLALPIVADRAAPAIDISDYSKIALAPPRSEY